MAQKSDDNIADLMRTTSATSSDRNKRRWPLIIIGVAAVAFFAWRTMASDVIARFSVDRVRARVKSWKLEGVTIEILLDIRNDSGVSIPIDGFWGSLKYGPHLLSMINAPSPLTLKAGAITTASFNAVISYADLSTQIIAMIESKNFIQNLTIDGYVQSSGIRVPVSKSLIAIG